MLVELFFMQCEKLKSDGCVSYFFLKLDMAAQLDNKETTSS